MTDTRFSLALEQGLLALPDGDIAVLNAAGDMDLSFAAPERMHLSQSFYPDHTALTSRGFSVSVKPAQPAAASLVLCHRSKPATFDLIARAAELTAAGGIVAVEGAKTDGVESVLKAVRARFDGVEVYSKAHGKLFWFPRPDTLPDLFDWQAKPITIDGGFTTYPGVFSSDGIDKGSALLAQHLPDFKGPVADLGAGWGYLARKILSSEGVTTLDLIEADHHALEAAKLNISDARAAFHWGDVTYHTGKNYAAVVSNPPFHLGRKPAPELGQMFIRRAADMLMPKGQFWMVANRNLPYEQTLNERFGQVDTIAQTAGFKVICARRPLSLSQAARTKR
ncbi:class I SAM-dependent methyltransferase [Litoreibacter arenae]|uniref:Ribosomal RNA small subunit methyltransferase C n=1 Tax=Litoreibacter arenae DSM 19593 TaxID=1123360 RepID=S9QQ60_9RHOB|nr:class I SAM-dependent methyltransferase [Litoreibacter arenae]EPX81763.1 Ribosomal RNA small subunit methyltransferase C [Litoreibacter arenae DSM 19593]